MSKKLIFFIVCFSGYTGLLSAMFNQTDQKIQITVVSHAKNPDAPLVSADPKIITAQDFMQHARCPVTVAIHNGGDVPIVISSASCCNADFLSATNAFNDVSINASKKAGALFAVHATIAVLTVIFIYKAVGLDLYEIFKKTTLRHAHKRADAAEQKILASGEEVTGWLSLLPISYMGGLYRLLRKRQQLVPFIKRTLPALYKKMVARIAGVEYVDVDTEKLLISELAIRTHGSLSTVVYNYAQLIDLPRMASVIGARAPLSVLALIGGITGMFVAPYYWYELRAMNYALRKKLNKQVLSDKAITIMPGGFVEQLIIFPTMAVDSFNFRIFNHDGVTQKTQFAVKLV